MLQQIWTVVCPTYCLYKFLRWSVTVTFSKVGNHSPKPSWVYNSKSRGLPAALANVSIHVQFVFCFLKVFSEGAAFARWKDFSLLITLAGKLFPWAFCLSAYPIATNSLHFVWNLKKKRKKRPPGHHGRRTGSSLLCNFFTWCSELDSCSA